MAPRTKRIRDLKRTAKDFPVLRKAIEAEGWVPHVLCDSGGAYWDGSAVRDKDGKLHQTVDSVPKQMINMILEGSFGEEVKDAIVDYKRYWKIRDDLIEFPKPEVIAREGLHV